MPGVIPILFSRLPVVAALAFAGLGLQAQLAQAQATPTATRTFRFALFGSATATSTGFAGGRNVGITSGLDVDLPAIARFRPAFELRGSYPIDGGHVDAQRNFLGGLRVGYSLGERFRPYAFGLFGRGRIDFNSNGYQLANTPVFYTVSSSNVTSYGAGLDVALTGTISTRLDLQINHQKTPVSTTGSLNAEAVSIGLVWSPSFNGRRSLNTRK